MFRPTEHGSNDMMLKYRNGLIVELRFLETQLPEAVRTHSVVVSRSYIILEIQVVKMTWFSPAAA